MDVALACGVVAVVLFVLAAWLTAHAVRLMAVGLAVATFGLLIASHL